MIVPARSLSTLIVVTHASKAVLAMNGLRTATLLLMLSASCGGRAPATTRVAAARAAPARPSEPAPSLSSSAPVAAAGIETCAEPCTGCIPYAASHGKGASRPSTPAEDALLARIFDKYLRSGECLVDEMRVDADAVDEHPISHTKLVVDGSFTGRGLHQTLITFFMGHCGVLGPHSERYGKTVLVLLQEGKVISVSGEGPTDAVYAMPIDVEDDGVNELLTESGDYGGGAVFSSAELWSFAQGSSKSLAHFDMSLDGSCKVNGQDFDSELLARRDPRRKTLCFLQRRRDVPCPPPPPEDAE